MTPRWPPLPRRLPRTLAPLRWETCHSYLGRLAAANRLSLNDIDQIADIGDDDPASLDRLAALTSHPAAVLLHALPELRHHAAATSILANGCFPIPETFINDIRPPCRRCAAAMGADPSIARVWATHDANVCIQHRLWIGEGNDYPHQQPDLGLCPDIVHAQIRHLRILRRHGRAATRAAFRTAAGLWPDLITTGGYSERVGIRIARLHPPNGASDAAEARTQAASYPETVAFSAILASPHWRAIATSRAPADSQRFHREFRRRVAPEYHQHQYPRFLFWLRRDLEWHPGQIDETSPDT